MFISFAPPKEMNQRKRGRKRQPHLFFCHLRQALSPSEKQDAVRTFSGSPSRRSLSDATLLMYNCLIIRLLITCEKKGDASPFQKPQVKVT
jgi:hypothetical protein